MLMISLAKDYSSAQAYTRYRYKRKRNLILWAITRANFDSELRLLVQMSV